MSVWAITTIANGATISMNQTRRIEIQRSATGARAGKQTTGWSRNQHVCSDWLELDARFF